MNYLMLYNYSFFDELRENMYAKSAPLAELNKQPLKKEIKYDSSWQIVCASSDETIKFAAKDNRLGFHGEALGYFYNAKKLIKR